MTSLLKFYCHNVYDSLLVDNDDSIVKDYNVTGVLRTYEQSVSITTKDLLHVHSFSCVKSSTHINNIQQFIYESLSKWIILLAK